ncbi:dihydrofolate reductase [Legionella fallonii]|uniref:Dihydrofolate reductase n=1 Tax=Legionella fallonii LLAP-10 TaxID=1212491 RepID=A0A098G1C6_9GAMM|nr:dihydrofolate reductase [Legionella fallonii]CEG55784.1 Dihydrofolate reductase [Legionella fallonii LLAP-10]
MAIISLIAAIDEAGGLGANNQLLCHLPADLQHFKKVTMGKPIVMGRKTFASIGKPLPGRANIILSHSLLCIEGVIVFDSLSKAIEQYKEYDEVMIIGGAEIYKQSIGLATRLYITRIHHRFAADVFFPTIDQSLWHCQSEEFRQKDEKNQYDVTFCTYERY